MPCQHTHTHTIARQTGNNSVSECQNPHQLDIKQDRACPTPIGAFLQYRARGRGASCYRSRHTHTHTHRPVFQGIPLKALRSTRGCRKRVMKMAHIGLVDKGPLGRSLTAILREKKFQCKGTPPCTNKAIHKKRIIETSHSATVNGNAGVIILLNAEPQDMIITVLQNNRLMLSMLWNSMSSRWASTLFASPFNGRGWENAAMIHS